MQQWSFIRSAARIACLIGIIACGTKEKPADVQKPSADDIYDMSRMDMSPKPSTVTTDPVTGKPPFSGATPVPALTPVGTEHVKEVRLDAINKVIDLAPGVKYAGWTFGNDIPGQTVRVRQGDLVKFVMTNRTNETIGGMNVSPAMMHSIDFHSAMVSPQDKYKSIAPGETIRFEFVANYPGVYMYHCGTPPIFEHIASGMYGMMIVEPRGGYPTKVDREFAIVQSEFYAKPDPQGRKVDGVPLFVFDSDAMLRKQPTHVTFNGRATRHVSEPFVAKAGERIRMFVLNVGPNDTSSFHVVGTIFDRVWDDGNVANQTRGKQTVLLGASNGTIVEFLLTEKAKYIVVDHEFTDVRLGAVGLIDATGGAKVVTEEDHQHGPSAPARPKAEMIASGKNLFEQRCVACHTPPAGAERIAPDLAGVTKRRPEEWLVRWVDDPTSMLANDPTAQTLLREWKGIPMPDLQLDGEQAKDVVEYLKSRDSTR